MCTYKLQNIKCTSSARADILHVGGDEKPDINFAWPKQTLATKDILYDIMGIDLFIFLCVQCMYTISVEDA